MTSLAMVAGELAAVGFAEAEEIGRGGFGVVYPLFAVLA